MKYRYDKALDKLVADHERDRKPIEPLPVDADLQEQIEVLRTMRATMERILFGRTSKD